MLPLFDQAITALWASQTRQAGEMRCWLVIPELTITLSRTFSLLCETLASVVSDVRCRVVVSNFATLSRCPPSPVTGGHCLHVGVALVVEAHSAQAQTSQPAVQSLREQENKI